MYYKKKFLEEAVPKMRFIHKSLSTRFNYDIYMHELSVLIVYRKIEKRGFYVIIKETGEVLTCPEQVKLNGDKVIKQNLQRP